MNNFFADNYFADIDFNAATDREAVDQLELAKKQVQKLLEGETFLLSDLFYGYEWKRISKPERILLGRNFNVFAKSKEGKALVEISDKKIQNKQLYIKK